MRLDDRVDDRQTETDTCSTGRPVVAGESLERVIGERLPESRTAIAHLDLHAVVVMTRYESDLSSAVPNRIVKQVRPQLS